MALSVTHIPLKYTPDEYKFKQLIMIPREEKCVLSQTNIEELFEKNIREGFPHVLALVHDKANGQDVFDANWLGEYLAKNKRWEWTNPATNKIIRKIDYFVCYQLSDGYRLVKEIDTGQISTGETYENLWFCNNLAAASDPDNPYAFHSIRAMARHYQMSQDSQKEKEAKYSYFKSVEKHYGKGMAQLLIPAILDTEYSIPEKLLFDSFNYEFVNDFFLDSFVETLIQEKKVEFFNPEKNKESKALYQVSLIETLNKNLHHSSYGFIKCLSSILGKDSENLEFEQLYPFLIDSNKDITYLTQALLYTGGQKIEAYIQNLTEIYPNWPLGKAYMLSSTILNKDRLVLGFDSPVDQLRILSADSKDPLLLKLISTIYERFSLTSSTWASKANLYMRRIFISRFDIPAAEMFAKAIEESEPDNALSIVSTNFECTKFYSSLVALSDRQIAIGLKTKNKALYEKGVANGITVFEDREKHNLLNSPLGKTLIAEITLYKSEKAHESIGVQVLEYALKANTVNPSAVAKLSLAEYRIRKGTTLQAQEAYKWLLEIMSEYPKDPSPPYYFTRYALRFAKNEHDLNAIETSLAEIEKTNNKLPLFYLLKALWYSHPLNRNRYEWFISASQNLKKAFENADQSDIDFVMKNLHRFDKLNEEDQTKCRADILSLLGLGNI